MVVTWLNKAKEAEEKRTRAAAEPVTLDTRGGVISAESSDDDDEDQDEFVYDIQVKNDEIRCRGLDLGVAVSHGDLRTRLCAAWT